MPDHLWPELATTSPFTSSPSSPSLQSSCLSFWPSTSSSTMWWTNSLCTLADEDLGTLAENEPPTGYEPNDHFITEAFVEYTQESSGEQRSPNDFDYDDVTIGKTPPWCVPKASRSLWRRLVVLSVVVSQSWLNGETRCLLHIWFTSFKCPRKSETQTPKENRWGLSWSDKESRFSLTEEVFKSWMRRSSRKKKKFVRFIKETNDVDKIINFFTQQLLAAKNWDFREAHERSLSEMEELKRFQGSTFDTIARRNLVEDRDTILDLTGKVQELQNEVNCMNDSRDFQDAGSVRSGHSHVTSRPVSFPPHLDPGGMPRRSLGMRAAKMGRQVFGTHVGLSGNVFANPTASSSAPYPQESNPWNSNVSEHTHSSHVVKSENHTTGSGSEMPVWTVSPKIQSSQWVRIIEELWCRPTTTADLRSSFFTKFPSPATFAWWKIWFKLEVCTCSPFPTEAVHWIKEVELVDSVDDLKSSCSVGGIQMPNFEVLDAKIASALNRIIHNTQFKRKVSLEEQKKPKKRTVSSVEDRSLTWSTSTSGSLEPTILSRIMPTYLQLFFKMMIFRNSIRNGTEFWIQWRKSHLMISWTDCENWEYVSLINSKTYWNCTIRRFTRRKQDLIITDWRQWWREVSSKKFEIRILGAEVEIMKETPWSRIRWQNSVNKEL